MSLLEVELENGKYTYIQHDKGGSEVLRHGEPWRDVTGDNVILLMAYKIDEQAQRIAELKSMLAEFIRQYSPILEDDMQIYDSEVIEAFESMHRTAKDLLK